MGLKRLRISASSLIEMCINDGDIVSFKCTKGLPKGTKCVGGHFDYIRNVVDFVISHKSFPNVPEGHEIPLVEDFEFSHDFSFADCMKEAIKKNEK
jgi:hypothetical protein